MAHPHPTTRSPALHTDTEVQEMLDHPPQPLFGAHSYLDASSKEGYIPSLTVCIAVAVVACMIAGGWRSSLHRYYLRLLLFALAVVAAFCMARVALGPQYKCSGWVAAPPGLGTEGIAIGPTTEVDDGLPRVVGIAMTCVVAVWAAVWRDHNDRDAFRIQYPVLVALAMSFLFLRSMSVSCVAAKMNLPDVTCTLQRGRPNAICCACASHVFWLLTLNRVVVRLKRDPLVAANAGGWLWSRLCGNARRRMLRWRGRATRSRGRFLDAFRGPARPEGYRSIRIRTLVFLLAWGTYACAVLVVVARPLVWGLHTRWQTLLGFCWGLLCHVLACLVFDRVMPHATATHLPVFAAAGHRKRRFVLALTAVVGSYAASMLGAVLTLKPAHRRLHVTIAPSRFALDAAVAAFLGVALLRMTSSQPGYHRYHLVTPTGRAADI